MAYVDVELDDFDFDDLVKEVKERLKQDDSNLSEIERKLLSELGTQISRALKKVVPETPSLADAMKVEFLTDIQGKYSEQQLRAMEFEYRDKHNIR